MNINLEFDKEDPFITTYSIKQLELVAVIKSPFPAFRYHRKCQRTVAGLHQGVGNAERYS